MTMNRRTETQILAALPQSAAAHICSAGEDSHPTYESVPDLLVRGGYIDILK